MAGTWSKAQAWQWYNTRPWIRGCNFMSSDDANRIDQWQALTFDEHLQTADRELALAASLGYNSIRIIPEFIVWYQEHDGFFQRFDRYLETAWSHGISAMVVLGNDCMPPKGPDWVMPSVGPQHFDIGYHGGRKVSQHGTFSTVGYHLLDDPEFTELHYRFVREIVARYRQNPRVLMWDVYNEPGNSNRGDITPRHLRKYFEIVRGENPRQPLTCGLWRDVQKLDIHRLTELEQIILESSDILSFHSYGSYTDMILAIRKLRQFGRPIINTEWLARCLGNNVEELFPLFYLERIGCYNWGFVAGKYQTYEPWNAVWDQYEKNHNLNWDFTKWFHDLYRPNLRPYNPRETELIHSFCQLAEEDFCQRKDVPL